MLIENNQCEINNYGAQKERFYLSPHTIMKVKNEKTEQMFCNFHFVLEPFQPVTFQGFIQNSKSLKKGFSQENLTKQISLPFWHF
jgi:hypothetical protein